MLVYLLGDAIKHMMHMSKNTYKSVCENILGQKSMGTLIHIISVNNCKMDTFIKIANGMGYNVALINKESKMMCAEGENAFYLINVPKENEDAKVDEIFG